MNRPDASFSRAILIPLTVLFCLFSASVLRAQARKYERKSITSLGTVLVKPGLSPNIDIINNRLKAYIEVPRFDYNAISSDAVKEFVQKANKTGLEPTAISQSLSETVVPKILQVVQGVADLRAQGNLKEEDLARAAVDKLKLSGLTAADIEKVLNSAYIYLPVITEYEEKTVGDNFVVEMKGYLLWYQVITPRDGGKASVVLLQQASEPKGGSGSSDPNKTYQLKRRSVNGKDYARLSAAGAWAQNEALAMRNIPEFKLSAEVRSVEGQTVLANIGKREGVGLDDGFNLVDFFDDGKGGVLTKEVGFYRAAEVANNIANPNDLSRFFAYQIGYVERGSVLLERPRLPIDVRIRPKFYQFRLPRTAIPLDFQTYNRFGQRGVDNYALTEDATAAAGVDVGAAFNLAKVVGVTQLFAVVDLGVGVPTATPRNANVPFLLNGYLGIQKKFWFGPVNLNLAAMPGIDALTLSGTGTEDDDLEGLTIITLGAKLDAGVEVILNPDLMLSLTAGYKVAFSPLLAGVKFRNRDNIDVVNFSGPNAAFRDINFSGVNVMVGVSFTLPSLGTDLLTSPSDIDY